MSTGAASTGEISTGEMGTGETSTGAAVGGGVADGGVGPEGAGPGGAGREGGAGLPLRALGLGLCALGSVGGALAAVLDREQVHLLSFLPCLGLAMLGVGLARWATHREANDQTRREADFETLDRAMSELVAAIRDLYANRAVIDVFDLPALIDRRFPPHLEAFLAARRAILHTWGSQAYADVMSPLSAGERYLNRAWSTAVDGYIDEAHTSLERAQTQLEAAMQALKALARDPSR